MFKELKKKSIRRSIGILISVLFFVVVLTVAFTYKADNVFYVFEALKETKQLNNFTIEELKGKYVEGEVNTLFGNFAKYTKKSTTGEKTEHQYYIMYFDESYIGLKIPSDMDSDAWNIVEKTYDYFSGKTKKLPSSMHLKGYLRKMNKQEKEYFYEWFEMEGGFFADNSQENQENIDLYTKPILFEYDGNSKLISLIFLYGGGFLILISILIVFSAILGRNQKGIKKYISSHGGKIIQEQIEFDYKTGYKIDDAVFGKEFIIYNSSVDSYLICIKDVIWCHISQERNKKEISYYLHIYTCEKEQHKIRFLTSQESIDGFKALHSLKPYIPYENTNELVNLYNKNFQEFVDRVNKARILYEQTRNNYSNEYSEQNVYENSNTYNNQNMKNEQLQNNTSILNNFEYDLEDPYGSGRKKK